MNKLLLFFCLVSFAFSVALFDKKATTYKFIKVQKYKKIIKSNKKKGRITAFLFYTDSCPGSQLIAPFFKKATDKMKNEKIDFYVVSADKVSNKEIFIKNRVKYVPTLIFFTPDGKSERFKGESNEEELLKAMKAVVEKKY